MLFDKNGRCIPQDLSAGVCDPDQDFRLHQPKMEQKGDYANRIMRLQSGFAGILSNLDLGIIAERFQQETERLLALIRNTSQIANITNGVWLPLVLPKMETDDVGAELERYFEVVSKSYVETFDNRKFYNHRKGTLANQVSIIDGSRQDQLIERMKQGPVIGILFPNSLQGFSINAQREQMVTLPEVFILSGLDIAIAMAMYPDVLARDHNTPGLALSAFSWRPADYSLRFWAGDVNLGFGDAGALSSAYGSYSGGLLFFE